MSVSAPGCGRGRVRRRVSSSALWASDIIFWSGGGGSAGVLWRLWEGRTWGGPGLGPRPGEVSNWGCL